MAHITIIIKPRLAKLVDENGNATPELIQLIRNGRTDEIFFQLMNDIEALKERMIRYIDMIYGFFKNREWRQEGLEEVGTKILQYAQENVSMGYNGTDSLNNAGVVWQQRNAITKRLYRLRGFDPEGEGMSTGNVGNADSDDATSGRLIESFRIGDRMNVFIVKPDVGIVIVGTRFPHAKVLENGEIRNETAKHLGVTRDWKPEKWLIKALIEKEGVPEEYAEDEAYELIQELIDLANVKFPKRPFLKPAVYYVYTNDEAIDCIAQILGDHLRRSFESMPLWAIDKISVRIMDVPA